MLFSRNHENIKFAAHISNFHHNSIFAEQNSCEQEDREQSNWKTALKAIQNKSGISKTMNNEILMAERILGREKINLQ